MEDKEDRTRLERLIAIDERISNNRYPTMRALCQAFNVRPRTIYADIRLLRDRFGLDIRFDRFRKGYYNANPGKRIPIGDLAENDYVLLMTGLSFLGSTFGNQIRSTLRNAVTYMGKRLSFELDNDEVSFDRMFITSRNTLANVDPDVLASLCRALLQHRNVMLKMLGEAPISCTPFSFIETDNGWQLLALNLSTGKVEQCELAKMTHCQVTEEQTKVDRSGLLDQFLATQKP
jgi:predicted DNA-binding transcriptional regulator YafY